MSAKRRLVVFSDDFGRHPSSMQHLARELLQRFEIDWVNTIGTRRPSLSLGDAKRAFEKLAAWTKPRTSAPSEPLPAGLTVHAPVHWPGFRSTLERGVNARLFDRALRPLVERADAVVTTASICAGLAARTSDARWIYYCVDDLSEWPGLDAEPLRAMEVEMLPLMREVIAVSKHLQSRLRALGRESTLLTHGIELDHWRSVAARGPRSRRERPTALFFGNADKRLDTAVVIELARTCDLVMVGPKSALDPALENAARIQWRAAVPYRDLPKTTLEADVLVMPYADLPVTRAMQPLKLKEYLATGLPVVAAPLPANVEWADALDLGSDPVEFAELVRRRAFEPLPREQAIARERLVDESWAAKARVFERVVLGERA